MRAVAQRGNTILVRLAGEGDGDACVVNPGTGEHGPVMHEPSIVSWGYWREPDATLARKAEAICGAEYLQAAASEAQLELHRTRARERATGHHLFDESKHPRHPAGTEHGGEFREKGAIPAQPTVDQSAAERALRMFEEDMRQWYTEKEGFSAEYLPEQMQWLRGRYEESLNRSLPPLRSRLENAGVPGVVIKPYLDYKGGLGGMDDIDSLLDPEATHTMDYAVDMPADGDAMPPGFTVWSRDDGTYEIEDVLDIGDKDFFPNGPESATAQNYAKLVDAARGLPLEAQPDSFVTVYRGMSDTEFDHWVAGGHVEAGKFFTSAPTVQYAMDVDKHPPVLRAFRVPRSMLVQTGSEEFQLRQNGKMSSGRIEPVTAAGWDESKHPREPAGTPMGGRWKSLKPGDRVVMAQTGHEGTVEKVNVAAKGLSQGAHYVRVRWDKSGESSRVANPGMNLAEPALDEWDAVREPYRQRGVTMYRGITLKVPTQFDMIGEASPERVKWSIQANTMLDWETLGIHWTTDRAVAERYSTPRLDEGGFEVYGLLMEAQALPEDIVAEHTDEMRYYGQEAGVVGPKSGEKEVTVRPGSRVRILRGEAKLIGGERVETPNMEDVLVKVQHTYVKPFSAAGWDEAKHPRYPAGDERGGQFAPKHGGAGELLGSDRDPQWAEDPITPKDALFRGMFGGSVPKTYSALKNSTAVWNGRTNPDMQYDLDPDYSLEVLGATSDNADLDAALHDYQTKVEERMRTVGQEGELRIQTPFDHMGDILDDGRFKSQFEVPHSQGAFLPNVRAAQEEMFFGYPQDMPVERRPIYGWLQHPDNKIQEEILKQYGEVSWILKPELKNRTTVSFMDSLSRPIVPGPLNNPGWRATPPPGYQDNGMHAGGMVTDHVHETGLFDDVIETQYHGGVSLDDVASVRIEHATYGGGWPGGGWLDSDREKIADYRRRLAERGITLEIVDEYGDPVSLETG